MLISQIVTVNEAALEFYRRGCAECTVLAVARLKASGMAITATVPEPRPPSSFGASSNR
jgi:hypothetical protein